MRARARQVLATGAVFGLCFAVGFSVGFSLRKRAAGATVTAATDTVTASAAAVVPLAPGAVLPQPKFQRAAQLLERSPASARVKLRGDGEQGVDLWIIAALAQATDLPTAEQLYWEEKALARMATDPERALKELHLAWDSFQGAEFGAHRAAVLMLVSGAPGGAEEFAAEAEAELRRPVETAAIDGPEDDRLSTGPGEAAPVAAQGILLKSTLSDDRAIAATIEALLRQPSGFVRGALLSQFRELRNPAWPTLVARLRAQGWEEGLE